MRAQVGERASCERRGEAFGPDRIALQAGLVTVAVAGAIGRRILEDGFSGLGMRDVRAPFASDATLASLAVQLSAALALRGATVDLGLGALALGPGLGVGAVEGGGGGHERREVLPEHFHFALERQSGVLRSGPEQSLP